MFMQNNIADDYWQLARLIGWEKVNVQFRYVFVCMGLDWCLSAKRFNIKEGLRRLLYAMNRATEGWAVVGICGVSPRYEEYRNTKIKMVTFNRTLADVVKECRGQYKVEYLPTHLQFLCQDGDFIIPLKRYFNHKSELTLAGGLVLREVLFKELQLIPMDRNH